MLSLVPWSTFCYLLVWGCRWTAFLTYVGYRSLLLTCHHTWVDSFMVPEGVLVHKNTDFKTTVH
jgi:hypothetical protein